MPWTLDIHHIGLPTTGDATLFIARFWNGGDVFTRTMLIDGGRIDDAAVIVAYAQRRGVRKFDVIVATHYDADHFNGLRILIAQHPALVAGSILLDQGEAGQINRFNEGPLDTAYGHRTTGRDGAFQLYLNAISAQTPDSATGSVLPDLSVLRRPTAYVDSSALATTPYYLGADWLVGKEILWSTARCCNDDGKHNPYGAWRLGADGQLHATNGLGDWDAAGNPVDAAGNNAIPDGAPQIRCIAANNSVLTDTGPRFVGSPAGLAFDDNRKSLGFLVTFNNFKYFIGGDLTLANEDELRGYLNPYRIGSREAASNRVAALKISHHGGNTSTSRAFVDTLLPGAAFISCGNANPHGHPSQEVVNVLEGYPRDNVRRPEGTPPTYRPINQYYLTGYQVPDAVEPLTYGGVHSHTAGDSLAIAGHVSLRVLEEESQRDPGVAGNRLFSVNYWDFFRSRDQDAGLTENFYSVTPAEVPQA